jgi:hypothetical protein
LIIDINYLSTENNEYVMTENFDYIIN